MTSKAHQPTVQSLGHDVLESGSLIDFEPKERQTKTAAG